MGFEGKWRLECVKSAPNHRVHWSINPPPIKSTTTLFFAKPPLESLNCPNLPFLGNPPIYWFFVNQCSSRCLQNFYLYFLSLSPSVFVNAHVGGSSISEKKISRGFTWLNSAYRRFFSLSFRYFVLLSLKVIFYKLPLFIYHSPTYPYSTTK